ncbi:MAG: 5-(carboxyamino)imidazole ribonucleotide mutase [Candidatus Dormibacteraceae bacterium]
MSLAEDGSRGPARVGLILGSKSDLPLMERCLEQLDQLQLVAELKVCSAHRDPAGVMEWATSARERGLQVVIAAAGGAAHLPGVVAAWTDLPVIGVPVPTPHLGGADSLFSIVQMPSGVPVATMAIGEAGAKNAAWLAARILGIADPDVAARHGEKRKALAAR